MSKFQRYLLGMFFVILAVNILGLWTVEYFSMRRLSKLEKITTNLQSDVSIAIRNSAEEKEVVSEEIDIEALVESTLEKVEKEESDNTPEVKVTEDSEESEDLKKIKVEQGVLTALVEQFQDKLASLSKRLKLVESNQAASTVSTTTTPAVTQPVVSTAPTIKEQTVYIGSGSSSSTNWTDISSAVIELNSANYPNLSRVIFEANLSIIGGEAYARLKNKTTGQVIEISEVSHNNSTPTQKLSGSFGLTAGSNEYIVQLRSSSSEKVVLDSARLRLFY
ncbi:MAG: hypothetical protein OEX81_01400 [Candidatus Pacebacteria bacterium]|nr:hypothetical protein [Candidatus Paceibacterota bacterium]